MAGDYGSQKVLAVHPAQEGGELIEDEIGNTTLVYRDAIEVTPEAPLCMGTVSDVVLYSKAFLKIKPKYLKAGKVPADIQERFAVDDPILTLTDVTIVDLAARLADKAETPLDVALHTWRYVFDHVQYGRVERPTTAAQVLEWKKGKRGEYSKLIIALLRANGIPARGVWCLRAGNSGPAGNDHAWAEAWVAGIGWSPIRPQEEPPTNDQYSLGYHSYQVVCRPQCGMDELRAVKWEKLDCPTGYRGVGFSADVPEGNRKASIALFQDIANDKAGKSAARHLKLAHRAHRAVQPMILWLLTASPDPKVGSAAAELLVEICGQQDRRLDLERFFDASPRLVKQRIDEARS